MAHPAPPSFDPGLTQQYTGALLRTINKDGTFNVRRYGGNGWIGNAYLHLVTATWPRFLMMVTAGYLLVNTLFATIYWALGPESLRANDANLGLSSFTLAFFFSVHTLTTVGYGDIYPLGLPSNIVAAFEAALGLMGFALATGLLFARFSRPSARLVFSESMVYAPYRDLHSIQFRVANARPNVLMEVSAEMVLMTVEAAPDGTLKRKFTELALERKSVYFLALTWTVVHPIDEASPLWGKTRADLERLQAEVLIMLKGFDDSFSQVVHSRYSYRWDEVAWSQKFVPAFEVSPTGHLELDVRKVGSTTSAPSTSH